VVQLVDAQQVAVATELGQVQFGRSSERLVCGHIAREPTAGVGTIFGCAHGMSMAQIGPPGGIDERLLGLAT
jgi:hypothetical protein